MIKISENKRGETKGKENANSSDEENSYFPLKYPLDNGLVKNTIKIFKISKQCNEIIKTKQTVIECRGTCVQWYHCKCSKNVNKQDERK